MVFYPVFVVAIVPLEYRTLLFSLSLFHSGIIFCFCLPTHFLISICWVTKPKNRRLQIRWKAKWVNVFDYKVIFEDDIFLRLENWNANVRVAFVWVAIQNHINVVLCLSFHKISIFWLFCFPFFGFVHFNSFFFCDAYSCFLNKYGPVGKFFIIKMNKHGLQAYW